MSQNIVLSIFTSNNQLHFVFLFLQILFERPGLDEDTIEIATKPKHASHDGSINGLKKAIQDLKASSPNGDQSRRLVPLLVELGNAYGDAQQLEKKQHCLNHALHIQEREYGT